MLTASFVLLRFLAYSFLGWVLEAIVRCLLERRFVNPGFLTGPVVPIYGVGAMGILICTEGIRGDPVLVFFVGVLVATLVEYIGHLLLQRLLGIVLWDYSTRFCNVQGRVCLGNSLSFGLAGVAVVHFIDPTLTSTLDMLDPLPAVALASALTAIVAIDWTRSVAAIARLRPEIQSIHGSLAKVRHRLEAELGELGTEYDHRTARLLKHSRKVITRLESAFPSAHTVLAFVQPRDADRARRPSAGNAVPHHRDEDPLLTGDGSQRR
jgi:uncharacterized membrane protein